MVDQRGRNGWVRHHQGAQSSKRSRWHAMSIPVKTIIICSGACGHCEQKRGHSAAGGRAWQRIASWATTPALECPWHRLAAVGGFRALLKRELWRRRVGHIACRPVDLAKRKPSHLTLWPRNESLVLRFRSALTSCPVSLRPCTAELAGPHTAMTGACCASNVASRSFRRRASRRCRAGGPGLWLGGGLALRVGGRRPPLAPLPVCHSQRPPDCRLRGVVDALP